MSLRAGIVSATRRSVTSSSDSAFSFKSEPGIFIARTNGSTPSRPSAESLISSTPLTLWLIVTSKVPEFRIGQNHKLSDFRIESTSSRALS